MPTIFTSLCKAAPRVDAHRQERPLALMVLAGLATAFWPLASWYLERMRDGSDDPLGLMALAVAIVMLWKGRAGLRTSLAGCAVAFAVLAVVLVYHRQLPPLLEALLAILALCGAFALPRQMPGVVCLLALSLPLVASLQFFLGYPLRIGTAIMAEGILSVTGMEVTREGTQLLSHHIVVGVDPPCSGVRMLWMGCFAAATLAAVRRLKPLSTLTLISLAVTGLLFANGVRAALLFPSEAGIWHWPSWLHETAGLVVYLPVLWFLGIAAGRLEHLPIAVTSIRHQMHRVGSGALWLSYVATGLLGLGIATGGLRALPSETVIPLTLKAVAWPHQWNGHVLEPLALTAREQTFAAGFPGKVQRFRCGPGELILRQVNRSTRLLHSSRDCFQAGGYEIHPLDLWRDASNRDWSGFLATQGQQRLRVYESITNARGASWHDVGAWFWAALFHPGDGPWMAATWIQAEPAVSLSP